MAENGFQAVVGEAVGKLAAEIEAAREAAAGAQDDLFSLPTRYAGDLADVQREKARNQASARGVGRPPGAQNKATRDMRDFLRARGFDPLVWMVRWAQHTPETLAAELRCSSLDAFDRLHRLHAEMAGYFYGRMLPVASDGREPPTFVMVVPAAAAQLAGGERPPWEYGSQEAPRQALSHAPQSHDAPEPAS